MEYEINCSNEMKNERLLINLATLPVNIPRGKYSPMPYNSNQYIGLFAAKMHSPVGKESAENIY